MPSPKLARPLLNEHALLVDELGTLEVEMAPYGRKLARIELLRKMLRAACPVRDEEAWTAHGESFVAILGPRALERSISFPALVKAIGVKAFAAFATCTLKALEEHAAPAVIAAVVSSANTGSRTLKTFEKGKP